jgi:hypothetical protein
MQLFTKKQISQLLKNGANSGNDHKPVVKLFTPDANCTWLITEIDPDQPDLAFGLCDLGMGFPELGYISLTEIKALRGYLGLPVERDQSFEGKYPISVYARAASYNQSITENTILLDQKINEKHKNIN